MRKQRQYECVGYTVESTSFVEIEFKMRNRIDSVKMEVQKERDRLERRRNKWRELKKNREWIIIRRFLLFVDRSFQSENQVTTNDLEQTDYLNQLNIRTSASNKRFKSNSIYILSSTLNHTRCSQFINTSKLIITTASDINWSENWNIYSQLNSLLILSKTTDPIYLKQ